MKVLLALFIFLPAIVKAQYIEQSPTIPFDSLAHKICYTEIVKVDSLSKEQIYTCVREWFNRSFDIGHAVVSMDDYNAGHLIARGTVFGKKSHGLGRTGMTISFIIDLFVKDGKYKYVITDFNLLAGIDGNLLPDWESADPYAIDPKHKNKKGEYTGAALQYLGILDGNIHYMINNLKDAVSKKLYSYKMKNDF
ncbi:MAG TPA: DUF4468 domain-containing protein [Chitinophagaceae bacterium]